MDAIDFLESAKHLLVADLKEVHYRNAISRAYYSAFHTCKDLMAKHPKWEVATGTTHEKLINNLKKAPRQELKTLGNQLERIKYLRTFADYDMHRKFTYQEAKQTVIQSQKIINEILSLKTI